MVELLFKEEVYRVIGAAMTVYNELGAGFLEPVYQEALEIELAEQGIQFEPQKELPIYYKGRVLKKRYQADLIVFGKVIVELKALDHLTSRDESQVLNYLKATGLKVALLINFGSEDKLEWKRLVKSRKGSANETNDANGREV
jgi:GxxExxY protein